MKNRMFQSTSRCLLSVLLSFDGAKVGVIRVYCTLSNEQMLIKTNFLDLYQTVLQEKARETYKNDIFCPVLQLFMYLCRQIDENRQEPASIAGQAKPNVIYLKRRNKNEKQTYVDDHGADHGTCH